MMYKPLTHLYNVLLAKVDALNMLIRYVEMILLNGAYNVSKSRMAFNLFT